MSEYIHIVVLKLKQWDRPTLDWSKHNMMKQLKRAQSFLERADESNKDTSQKHYNDDVAKISRGIMELVRDVEEVVDTSNLNLSQKNTLPLYERIINLFYYKMGSATRKIRIFLMKRQQHSGRERYNRGVNDEVPLLPQRDESKLLLFKSNLFIAELTDVIIGFTECVLGLDDTKLLEQFSKEVIEELYGLMGTLDRGLTSFDTNKSSEKINDLEDEAQPELLTGLIIGRNNEINKLREMLSIENKDLEGSSMVVVNVTGESGVGKTTLAIEIYHRFKTNFDCYAWVDFASRQLTSYVLQDTLTGFLKSQSMMVPSYLDAIHDMDRLKDLLRRCLEGKKFLLVLDDISSENWTDMFRMLSSFKCEGRVILTSRTSSQVPYNNAFQLNVGPLTPEDARGLLHKRALVDRKKGFQSDLTSTIDDILDICKGIPLAIATIGGMLSMKNMDDSEWVKASQSLREIDFKTLCYADLQPVLKTCFLYGALFPPHQKIPCKKLQRMWVAESLLSEKHGSRSSNHTDAAKSERDIAKAQMMELIRRNMFQVVRVGKDGEPKYVKLMQPMREFAIKRSEQFEVCTISRNGGNVSVKRPLRLVLLSNDNTNNPDLSGLHSFLVSDEGRKQFLFDKLNWVSKFRLLSVVDMEGVPIKTLPNSIGNLGLLQYLGLRRTKLTHLPSSIKKLQKLQTLDIRNTEITNLYAVLETSTSLRHLLLANSFGDKVVNLNIDLVSFPDLLTLSGVDFTDRIGTGLKSAKQLQKLSIGNMKSGQSAILEDSMSTIQQLRSLTIKCRTGEQIQVNTPNPLQNIVTLRIGGQVKGLLDWVTKLKHLKSFYVWDCSLKRNPFEALQSLSNLVTLSICNAYDLKKVELKGECFLNLKKLSILHCIKLTQWECIPKGAMTKLEKLTIGNCPNLKCYPLGLEDLTCLRVLQVKTGMSGIFVRDIQQFIDDKTQDPQCLFKARIH